MSHLAIPTPTRTRHPPPVSSGGSTLLDPFDRILGSSPQAETIRGFGRRAAAVDATVLITGETGTGKGVLARAIHEASARARAPFVAVNCAGVPEALFESEFFGHVRGAFTGALQAHRGLFEQADRGTLFLDEIGELPLPMQAKLLTVLEDGLLRKVGGERTSRVDTRLIAATGIDLQAAVAQQRFRSDLYHRLNVLEFRLPPLRERGSDIVELSAHFLAAHCHKYGCTVEPLTTATLAQLQAHAWPGNIRELDHAIEAAVVAAHNGKLRWRLLSARPALASPTSTAARYCFAGSPEQEKQQILDALHLHRGNRTRAARVLGMSRNTLIGKIRRLGIAASAQDPDDPSSYVVPE